MSKKSKKKSKFKPDTTEMEKDATLVYVDDSEEIERPLRGESSREFFNVRHERTNEEESDFMQTNFIEELKKRAI